MLLRNQYRLPASLRATVLALLTGCLANSALAEVRLPAVFADHMVLQRDLALPVWGWAAPGEKVTVTLGKTSAKTTADANGNWQVKLRASKANSTPQDLVIAGENTVTITDVLVGDVWLCSGQSNMEMELGSCQAPEDIAAANLPNLRQIKVELRALAKPATNVVGRWTVCTPATASHFTAVGFYFARRVQQEVGVPIGLLSDNWGGTRIEPWTPPCGFEMEPTLTNLLAGISQRAQAASTNATNLVVNAGTPAGIYNAMIHPVAPYGIKGALWYQGESNGGEGEEYYHKMRALIGGWRRVWNQGEFPFYFVQVANWQQPNDNPAGGDGWAKVRQAQTQSLQIPKTGMAVIIDIGEAVDIHPKDKFDVGERLARWALHDDYGQKKLEVSGPIYKSIKIKDGKATLSFDHLGAGLMVGLKDGRKPTAEAKDGKLARFAIAGADKKWFWADAVIDGRTVVVSSSSVPEPVAVRYAFSMNPAGCNLYNKNGLPASPFRTDNW